MTHSAPDRGTVPHLTADLAEIDAILTRHGITKASIEAQIDAEQAAMDEGTLVPISSVRRANKSARDPN